LRRWLAPGALSLALAAAPAAAVAGGTPGSISEPRLLLQTAGVLLNPSTVEVSESGTSDTYTVVLSSEPANTVTVTLATPGGQATAVSTASGTSTLTFTTENWDEPQSVTVNAVDDDVAEGDHNSAVTHTASGGGYDSVSIGSVTIEIDDNDVAGASVSPGTVNVAEGGATATYTLVLNSEPTSNVTITISPTSGQITATATSSGLGTLTFTPGSWDDPQSVTVTAVDDGTNEGNHSGIITHSASGGRYGSVPIASVTANIADNDTGVIVSKSNVRVREGGETATYSVVLGRQPTGTVTVTIGLAGGQATALSTSGSNSSLTFTSANWSTPQSVTVTAVDDDAVEGNHGATITHSVSGGGLAGAAPSVAVEIRDNDRASGDRNSNREKPAACGDRSLHPSLKALCRVLDQVPPQARMVIARVIERHAEFTPPGQQGRDDRGPRVSDDKDDRDNGARGRGRGNDGRDEDRRSRGRDDNDDDDRRNNRHRGRPSWAGGPGGPHR